MPGQCGEAGLTAKATQDLTEVVNQALQRAKEATQARAERTTLNHRARCSDWIAALTRVLVLAVPCEATFAKQVLPRVRSETAGLA